MDDVKTTETPEAAEPQEAAETPEVAETSEATEPRPQSEPKQFTKLGEDIGQPATAQPVNSPEPTADTLMSSVGSQGTGQPWKLPIATKFSERTWLIAATVFVALVTLLIFSFTPRRNRAVPEQQAQRTVETLTPELVMAGCGQPLTDVTKDLYPMIMRTMSYKPGGEGSVVLEFSRTAEENSQWILLSMKNGNGTIKYETAEMQMAALPCLASKK